MVTEKTVPKEKVYAAFMYLEKVYDRVQVDSRTMWAVLKVYEYDVYGTLLDGVTGVCLQRCIKVIEVGGIQGNMIDFGVSDGLPGQIRSKLRKKLCFWKIVFVRQTGVKSKVYGVETMTGLHSIPKGRHRQCLH